MRPLPIEPVAGTPGFVRGVSVIRGAPTPVVDLKALLENGENSATYGRFVTIKLGERRVAIGVDGVVGLTNLDSAQLGDLPRFCEMSPPTSSRRSAPATRSSSLCFVLRASFPMKSGQPSRRRRRRDDAGPRPNRPRSVSDHHRTPSRAAVRGRKARLPRRRSRVDVWSWWASTRFESYLDHLISFAQGLR